MGNWGRGGGGKRQQQQQQQQQQPSEQEGGGSTLPVTRNLFPTHSLPPSPHTPRHTLPPCPHARTHRHTHALPHRTVGPQRRGASCAHDDASSRVSHRILSRWARNARRRRTRHWTVISSRKGRVAGGAGGCRRDGIAVCSCWTRKTSCGGSTCDNRNEVTALWAVVPAMREG